MIVQLMRQAKTLVGTEVNVPGNNAGNQAVIGELVTDEVLFTLPEGVTPAAVVRDTNNTNPNNAGNETVRIRYRDVVLNTNAAPRDSQAGATRNNSVRFEWTGFPAGMSRGAAGQTSGATGTPTSITLVEPTVTTDKRATTVYLNGVSGTVAAGNFEIAAGTLRFVATDNIDMEAGSTNTVVVRAPGLGRPGTSCRTPPRPAGPVWTPPPRQPGGGAGTGDPTAVLADFWGINDPAFRGGARVAAGDVSADGVADLVVAAGFGGGPRVSTYDGVQIAVGNPANLFGDFFAFEPTLTNGSYVTVGDVDGDGFADVIAGSGEGGAPRVTGFSGKALLAGQQTMVSNFFAFDTASTGGARVAAIDLDQDGRTELLVGSGPKHLPRARFFDPRTATLLDEFASDWTAAADGVFVG